MSSAVWLCGSVAIKWLERSDPWRPSPTPMLPAQEATPTTQSTGMCHHSLEKLRGCKREAGEVSGHGNFGLKPLLAWRLKCLGPLWSSQPAYLLLLHPERAHLRTVSTGFCRRFLRSEFDDSPAFSVFHDDSELCPMIGPLASSSLWYPSMFSISPSFKEPTAKSSPPATGRLPNADIHGLSPHADF